MQQHGHRTAPLKTARFLKEVPQKKVVIHCEFSKNFEILEKHHVSYDATEMHGF
jgi:hypothetical protein